jgi:hypothetical protein
VKEQERGVGVKGLLGAASGGEPSEQGASAQRGQAERDGEEKRLV